jgi:hypothetical protein
VLITLSLTAILLTFLFSFFVQSAKIEKKLDTARLAISNRGHLQTRLQTILTSIDRGSMDPFFYTKQFEKEKNLSLIAIFDNGIDPDPQFSGSILARIYLDPEKNLCLATWPLTKEKNRPWRKEILFPNVKDFEFEFLGEKSASEHGIKENSRPITAKLAWKSNWAKTTHEVPGIIRLTLFEESSDKPLRYAFILPVSEPFITYSERKRSAT